MRAIKVKIYFLILQVLL